MYYIIVKLLSNILFEILCYFFSETTTDNKGIKVRSPRNDSPPPQPPQITPTEQSISDIPIIIPAPEVHLMTPAKNISLTPKTSGLILRAVHDVEDQFWNYPLIEREDGIIMISLYYLQTLLRF